MDGTFELGYQIFRLIRYAMAKSFLSKIRKHRFKLLIAAVIAFILLVILGYALGPDKTWKPPAQQQSEPR
jgi:hypothetical protein